jgi:hypothetical protein
MRGRGYENSLDRTEWLRQPMTIYLSRAAAKDVQSMAKLLLSAARFSEDPAVARAVERYQAAKDRLALLTENGDDDDGFT